MTDTKIIDRKSTIVQNTAYRRKTDGEEDLTFEECMKLARELKDFSRLPRSCRQFLDKKAVLHQACEGMTGDQVAHVAKARNAKIGRNMTHAQLQRRWTSRENPLRKKDSRK